MTGHIVNILNEELLRFNPHKIVDQILEDLKAQIEGKPVSIIELVNPNIRKANDRVNQDPQKLLKIFLAYKADECAARCQSVLARKFSAEDFLGGTAFETNGIGAEVKDSDSLSRKLNECVRIISLILGNELKNKGARLSEFIEENNKTTFFKKPKDSGLVELKRISFTKSRQRNNRFNRLFVLKITVEGLKTLKDEILDALEQYALTLDDQKASARLLELIDNDRDSDAPSINEFFKDLNESVIKLFKKYLKIPVLEHLYSEIEKSSLRQAREKGFEELGKMIRRLRIFEQYVGDTNKSLEDYEIKYAGEKFNLRKIFLRADAYDILPIIVNFRGTLGEGYYQDGDKKCFNVGITVKFNNATEKTYSLPIFDYLMAFLDRTSEVSKKALENMKADKYYKEKVVKIGVLYYFMYGDMEDDKVVNCFETFCKNLENDENLFLKMNQKIKNEYYDRLCKANIEVRKLIKAALLRGLDNRALERLVKASKEIPSLLNMFILKNKVLSISKDIINKDYLEIKTAEKLQNCFLYKEVKDEQHRNFISSFLFFGDESIIPRESLVSIKGYGELVDFFGIDETEKVEKIKVESRMPKDVLPIVMTSTTDINSLRINNFVDKHILNNKYIKIPVELAYLQSLKTIEKFIYEIVFSILILLFVEVIVKPFEKERPNFFVGLLRLQLGKNDEEDFLRDLTHTIAFLGRQHYSIDAQGINVSIDSPLKQENARRSLFVNCIKDVMVDGYKPNLQKLGILAVTSRKCDISKSRNKFVTVIHGQVLGVDCQDGKLTYTTLNNFLEFEESTKDDDFQMNRVEDEIVKLKDKGYRDIVYLSQYPYEELLGITDIESKFVNSRILQRFYKHGVRIYPMHINKFPFIPIPAYRKQAGYSVGLEELEVLYDDDREREKIAMLLFSGNYVGSSSEDEEKYQNEKNFFCYAAVYTSSLNAKLEPIVPTTIGVFNEREESDICAYLRWLHFIRYESSYKLNFRLNPFKGLLLDDERISNFSILVPGTGVQLNLFAMLSKLRTYLRTNNDLVINNSSTEINRSA